MGIITYIVFILDMIPVRMTAMGGGGGVQFIAATCSGQSLAEENQLPAGGGASSAWLCSPLLLVSVLLAACRLL